MHTITKPLEELIQDLSPRRRVEVRTIELTRQNQQLMNLLEQRSKQTKRVSLAEARKLLGLPAGQTEEKNVELVQRKSQHQELNA